MPISMWVAWMVLLVFQNFAFTFVSRARNSGSLRRHMIASVFSNLIFIIQFSFLTNHYADSAMHGALGRLQQVWVFVFYTALTMVGSISAHYYALRSEKGHARVGARKDTASFTQAEGELLRTRTLLIDTGDGHGTFTPEEIVKIKTVIGSKVEEEIVQVSVPIGDFESGFKSEPEGLSNWKSDGRMAGSYSLPVGSK